MQDVAICFACTAIYVGFGLANFEVFGNEEACNMWDDDKLNKISQAEQRCLLKRLGGFCMLPESLIQVELTFLVKQFHLRRLEFTFDCDSVRKDIQEGISNGFETFWAVTV